MYPCSCPHVQALVLHLLHCANNTSVGSLKRRGHAVRVEVVDTRELELSRQISLINCRDFLIQVLLSIFRLRGILVQKKN